MSTIGYESWAVDLADVGAIYPFQGGEWILVILGVVFWLGWHVVQLKAEDAEITYEMRHKDDPEALRRAMERY